MRKVALIACFLALPAAAISSYIYVADRAARRAEAQMRVERQMRADARVRTEELQALSQALSHAIVRYTIDKGKPPETLDDLIRAGYFKGLPKGLIDSGYFKGTRRRVGPGNYFDPALPPPPGPPRTSPTPRG